MAITDKRRRFLSLNEAASYCSLSRGFTVRQIREGKIKGKPIRRLKRWQIDADSLDKFLQSIGYRVDGGLIVCIMVVGSTLEWCAELSDLLPAGAKAVYAGSTLNIGRVFERERPDYAVIDFQIGRSESIDLARELTKTGVNCLAVALEDENDSSSLQRAGFIGVLRKPCSVPRVREMLLKQIG